MAVTTNVSIADWMVVRKEVVNKIKSTASQSKLHIEMAEALMSAGYIDVDAVLEPIRKAEQEAKDREEKRAAERKAVEDAARAGSKPAIGATGIGR